ncbi:MAG: heme exporter protein C [Motiliproteus sp.]|jgi:heme exporter protein C
MANIWKMPTWFYRLGSPRWSFEILGKLLPWFAVAAVALLGCGIVWGLAFAPADYQQGNSFRIIYIHVPAAIVAQSCYVLMAVAGAINLIWKMKVADMVAKSCAPIGASLAVLALATGAIWGKPTWGTWWVWDARLTAMLILLFLYMGVYTLHRAIDNEVNAGKAGAVLALVGMVNIPIIKYSVEWWNTLHQGSTFSITESPKMAPEMWMPLLIMVIGFYCFFSVVLMLRTRMEILAREKRTGWVKELVEAH